MYDDIIINTENKSNDYMMNDVIIAKHLHEKCDDDECLFCMACLNDKNEGKKELNDVIVLSKYKSKIKQPPIPIENLFRDLLDDLNITITEDDHIVLERIIKKHVPCVFESNRPSAIAYLVFYYHDNNITPRGTQRLAISRIQTWLRRNNYTNGRQTRKSAMRIIEQACPRQEIDIMHRYELSCKKFPSLSNEKKKLGAILLQRNKKQGDPNIIIGGLLYFLLNDPSMIPLIMKHADLNRYSIMKYTSHFRSLGRAFANESRH